MSFGKLRPGCLCQILGEGNRDEASVGQFSRMSGRNHEDQRRDFERVYLWTQSVQPIGYVITAPLWPQRLVIVGDFDVIDDFAHSIHVLLGERQIGAERVYKAHWSLHAIQEHLTSNPTSISNVFQYV